MQQDNENKLFRLLPYEKQLLPDVGDEWNFDESDVLLGLINERIASISDPAILSEFPHGSQRETLRQKLSTDFGVLAAARKQLLPFIDGALSDDDLRRLQNGEGI